MRATIATLVLAYLLGSIPFGYLLVRVFRREDIRRTGSGNIGATNVARSGAKGLGVLTLLLDLGKGFLAVFLARHVQPGEPGFPSNVALLAALLAVLGHVFPVWLAFKGGKGVATALGVLLALLPSLALYTVVVFIALLALTRIVSLASIVAAMLLPVCALLVSPDRSFLYVASVLFLAVLIISKHKANIQRLLAGTESRFSTGKKAQA